MEWPFEDFEPIGRLRSSSDEAAADCQPGDIWQARRITDGARVMVKVVSGREVAEREAALARAVDHPHVLAAEDVIDAGVVAALVLPIADRGSLAALLAARHRISWPEALTVLIPVADALAAAHERGLVHGDLSAGNIVIDAAGRPLLTDFGAARAAVESGQPVAATPTDVAPEIVRGAPPSAATDLFSLGSVALRCLTGRPAWPAQDFDEVLVQSTAGQWPDIDRKMAPAALCALVRRLLAEDPAERGSAAEISVALRSIGRPEPIRHETGPDIAPATQVRSDAVRPPAELGALLDSRGTRRTPRTIRPLLVAAAVAVIAVAGAVGWWWPGAQQPVRPDIAAAPMSVQQPAPAPQVAASPPPPSVEASVPSEPPVEPAEETEIEPDWIAVVTSLDLARADALATLDPEMLGDVYTPGSTEAELDAATIAELRDQGLRPEAVGHHVVAVDYVGPQPDGAVIIEVTAAQPPVTLNDDAGAAVGRTAGSDETVTQWRLVQTKDGYRIDRIWPTSP